MRFCPPSISWQFPIEHLVHTEIIFSGDAVAEICAYEVAQLNAAHADIDNKQRLLA